MRSRLATIRSASASIQMRRQLFLRPETTSGITDKTTIRWPTAHAKKNAADQPGGTHGGASASVACACQRRGGAALAALLCADAPDGDLRAEFPRPHDLQRPDRTDQKRVQAERHHHWPRRGLRLRSVLLAAGYSDR